MNISKRKNCLIKLNKNNSRNYIPNYKQSELHSNYLNEKTNVVRLY